MTVGRLKILSALLATLLIGALILLFHYRNIVQASEGRPGFGPGDAALVERAYRLEATREHAPIEQIKEQDYPRVVNFPDRNCVQLSPPLTSMGGHSLYCFRNTDGALVEQYQVGE